jgi:glycerophosphoryl diester phosphodiesterase
MSSRFFEPARPRLFAHRGYSARYPENTLPAFAAALDLGLDYLELDVHLSRDEAVVVHHDAHLSRTCGVNRSIHRLGLEEIKGYDPGWGFVDEEGGRPFYKRNIRIPTLEELFRAFPGALCNIEMKHGGQAMYARLLQAIRECGMAESVLVASHKDDVIQGFRDLKTGIPTNFCHSEVESCIRALRASCFEPSLLGQAEALQIPVRHGREVLVTEETVQCAHGAGVEVHVWTVNQEREARRLLDLGVDGIMSDDAKMLLRLRG